MNLHKVLATHDEAGTIDRNLVLRPEEMQGDQSCRHPVLEQTARELADAIAKMGI